MFRRAMKFTSKEVGEAVKSARKKLGVTQRDLALAAGTGMRFVIELEQGKVTCQLGKVLTVLNTLGITMELKEPKAPGAVA